MNVYNIQNQTNKNSNQTQNQINEMNYLNRFTKSYLNDSKIFSTKNDPQKMHLQKNSNRTSKKNS